MNRTIAEQIKKGRAKAGLSQAQAARAWGVSVRTLQKWEQGTSEPRGGRWERLRAILAGSAAPAAKPKRAAARPRRK